MKKVAYGRGLSILFAGAPGTGKTMCAQVIARQLNMEMYKINISQIVSKYIGETEKNLQAVFAEAKNSNCILFFDECDALFGKRSEVKDSHDRNANVEVAYLLQQIEEYDGVCILATNLIGNIDEAFMRRITYVVHFPFPDRRMREDIYRHMMPPAAPLAEDIDWGFLAEKFELSGGHIKNIVLSAAFMAAGENSPIGMRHLLRAAVGEMKKNEIVVVREELREYADLLEDEGNRPLTERMQDEKATTQYTGRQAGAAVRAVGPGADGGGYPAGGCPAAGRWDDRRMHWNGGCGSCAGSVVAAPAPGRGGRRAGQFARGGRALCCG